MQIANWLMARPDEDSIPSDSAHVKDASNMKKPPAVVHSRMYDGWRPDLLEMPEEDARQLSPQAIHRLRNEVVLLHLQGESRAQICATCSVSYTAVRKIIQLYQQGGIDALIPKHRGRKYGEKRSLSGSQELQIRQHIADSGLQTSQEGFVLWNRAAVSELIKHEFGLVLPLRTMDHYLQRWGFKPSLNVFHNARKEPDCQALLARAKDQQASVLWMQLAYLSWPTERPPDAGTATAQHAIFGTSNRSHSHWGVMSDTAHAASLVSYCESVRASSHGNLLMFVALAEPQLRRTLEQWLAHNKAVVECYYLPEMQKA